MNAWRQWLLGAALGIAAVSVPVQAQEGRRDRGSPRGEGRGHGDGHEAGRRDRADHRYDASRYGDDGNRYEVNRYDDQQGNQEPGGERGRGDARDHDRNRWDGRGERYGQRDGWDRDRWDRNDQRHGRHDGWNRDHWRRSWRHGWNGNRWTSPSRYVYPRGYSRRAWSAGLILPSVYYGSSYYVDWQPYGLSAPPYGARWVRVADDLLLVHLATGEVLDVLNGFFY